jgi:hypothetical protein
MVFVDGALAHVGGQDRKRCHLLKHSQFVAGVATESLNRLQKIRHAGRVISQRGKH